MQLGGFNFENYILMLPTWAQWFNILECYVLYTPCVCVYLRTNRDYFPIQH